MKSPPILLTVKYPVMTARRLKCHLHSHDNALLFGNIDGGGYATCYLLIHAENQLSQEQVQSWCGYLFYPCITCIAPLTQWKCYSSLSSKTTDLLAVFVGLNTSNILYMLIFCIKSQARSSENRPLILTHVSDRYFRALKLTVIARYVEITLQYSICLLYFI